MFAAGGGGVERFAVRREIEAPGVAGAGRDLLERGAVGLEADDAGGDAAKGGLAVAGSWVAGAVTDGGVNPAVHAPAHIVDDGVGIEGAETGVEDDAFILHVAFAVAVGV